MKVELGSALLLTFGLKDSPRECSTISAKLILTFLDYLFQLLLDAHWRSHIDHLESFLGKPWQKPWLEVTQSCLVLGGIC